jgi:Xaa-Pro dipeptidase
MAMQNLPKIPQGEFVERKKSIQKLMESHSIDLLFFYGDDRAVFGANHTRWLTDYAAHFEPILTVVPRNGDIHSATGAESETFYNNTAKIGQIHVVNEFNMPEEEYPYTKPIAFKKFLDILIQESGSAKAKIGFVGENSFPHWLIELIKSFNFQALPTEALELDYRALRASKSPAEIAVLRYGFEIAEAGLEAGIKALEIGITEREVAAEIEYTMRKMGSEGSGIDTIVGFGKKNTFPILTRTTFNTLQAGDLALLTIAPRYEGYHGVIARPISMGPAPKEIRAAIDGAIAASEASAAKLKVGAIGSDISGAGLDVLRKANLIDLCVYSGIHSVGTSEFEPPILTSVSEFILPNNSFLSIDVPLFMASWGGFRVETGYQVSNDGVTRFSKTPLAYLEK